MNQLPRLIATGLLVLLLIILSSGCATAATTRPPSPAAAQGGEAPVSEEASAELISVCGIRHAPPQAATPGPR